MSTLELTPGQVAVVLTPDNERNTIKARVILNSKGVNPADMDAMAQTMYMACLANGMASLAISNSDMLFDVGMEYMKNDINKAY